LFPLPRTSILFSQKSFPGKKVKLLYILSIAMLLAGTGCRYFASKPAPTTEQLAVDNVFGRLDGTVVFFDPAQHKFYASGQVMRRHSPCSTFKIISTLMGLDCGVVTSADTKMGYDGVKHLYPEWNRDLPLAGKRPACAICYSDLSGSKFSSVINRRSDDGKARGGMGALATGVGGVLERRADGGGILSAAWVANPDGGKMDKALASGSDIHAETVGNRAVANAGIGGAAAGAGTTWGRQRHSLGVGTDEHQPRR
jgi:hypothetical protein